MPSDTASLPRLSDEEFEAAAAYAATDDSALLEQEARRARVAEAELRERKKEIARAGGKLHNFLVATIRDLCDKREPLANSELIWIKQAQGLSAEFFELAEPILRKAGRDRG